MPTDPAEGSASDDGEMFVMQHTAFVSMYSGLDALSAEDNSDNDDDSERDVSPPSPKRKRARPAKRARAPPPATPPPRGAVGARRPKKARATPVYQISDDDDDASPPAKPRDSLDLLTRDTIARATAVLGQADAGRIAQEVDAQVRRDALLAERAREAEVRRRGAEARQVAAAAAAERAADEAADKPILLKVRSGDKTLRMRIRAKDPLKKMLEPFCNKFGLSRDGVVMEVDGEPVGDKDTADTHDLDDNMIVDVRVLGRR